MQPPTSEVSHTAFSAQGCEARPGNGNLNLKPVWAPVSSSESQERPSPPWPFFGGSFETGFLYVALAVLDHYVDQASLKLSEIHLLLECCDQRRAPPHLAFFCKFK